MGNEEASNTEHNTCEHHFWKSAYKFLALFCLVLFLFYVGDTWLYDFLKGVNVIESVEYEDYVDEAIFSSSDKALVLASREVQAIEKKVCQTHYHLYLITLSSNALLKVAYRAKINYAILPEPWEEDVDEKMKSVRLIVSDIFAQNIDLDYGSVVGTIEGGFLVRNEAWLLEMMMRNLSRKALANASCTEAIEEVREIIRKAVSQMVQNRYGAKKVEIIFKDEIKMKNGEN